jgi:hypothetical protein
MKFSKYIAVILLGVCLVGTVFGSTYSYTYNGVSYVATVSGAGISNPTLAFNLSNGYIVPQNPNATYSVYFPVENFQEQSWMSNTGGAISIFPDSNPQILNGNATVLKEWFQAGTGSGQKMGYAESIDGINWYFYSGNPITSYMVGGNVVKYGGNYYMFGYQGSGINVLESSNGVTGWSTIATGILPASNWDTYYQLYDVVWVNGTTWNILYSGCTSAGAWGIGYANASSPSGPWTEYAGNPVITKPASVNTLLGTVYRDSQGYYWLWCGGSQIDSTSTIRTDTVRFRSTFPNEVSSWVQNPSNASGTYYQYLYVNNTITETDGNANRQEQCSGIRFIYNGLTYIYCDYTSTSVAGNVYTGLLTTPLSEDNIIATNETIPDIKGLIGI